MVTGLIKSKNIWSSKYYSYYKGAPLSFPLSIFIFLLIFISLLTCLSLFPCLSLSLFTCLPLSLFIHLALSSHVSLLLCVCGCVLCWAVCCVLVCCYVLGCACCCGACVSSCLPLKNAPVCTFKTLPCVLSKRPCHIGHGRFESTHGSVLNVHTGEPLSSFLLSLSSRLCLSLLFSWLSSHTSLSLSLAISARLSLSRVCSSLFLSLSFSCRLSFCSQSL